MSVLMTLRVSGDQTAVEATDPAVLKMIAGRAKEHGALAHRFYGNGSEIFVADVWPDEASFKAFFDASPEIAEMMAAAGVTSAPAIEFWSQLDVDDSFG